MSDKLIGYRLPLGEEHYINIDCIKFLLYRPKTNDYSVTLIHGESYMLTKEIYEQMKDALGLIAFCC